MPKSLKVSFDFIETVNMALTRNGYSNQRALARSAGLSLATVSNFLTGKPVSYATFEELCRKLNLDWREITTSAEVISTPAPYARKRKPNLNQFLDWGTAIDISAFYGYSQELTQLQSWILQDGCRLLGLFGIGGVGKTTLATQLARQIQDQFDYVFWRSVPTVPCFDSMMTDLLSLFSHNKENQLNINQIIYYLRTHRCLIILDHVDIDHLKYMQFIKILAETYHQSCVIFTSREQYQEFIFLEYWLLSVRSLKLSNSLEIALFLIESQPLWGTDQEKYDLCNLCNNNPLKVKQMIVSIIHLYNGDISKFLKRNTS
ncbi:NB-ARC domain-containing protein [Aphanizomenon flos-aquae NRERC-008]|uniref:AAA family ATPase n=2 Tax=Aphanizomenonaceae TaxID=1892259 RepID=A0ABR8ISP0_APHFL|nr:MULTISPECIES: helix-turn-helix domain-containing protein [Aphanizomenon]MBD2390921.1 AAA family ATPase [Aphanizomenon flos-aquae FACHB-1171]MBD2642543.1 AAA family ATPase [Aphanizomenon sp. FACHB-1401]MBD2697434.1 AAA family ATPase [Aphanizomenon flos-aquae FACHB-1287]MBD2631609.1 AAA family ATPase [Aphanizomenon sp. FACHB-1399]MBD2657604.1 AAA family ATPase [Aphanizomenon flos-aquae FACHB-1265]